MSTALREQTINTLKLGHYAQRTRDTYLDWLIRLSQHYNRSPAKLTEKEVQAFLFPVPALKSVFAAKYRDHVMKAFTNGELTFHGEIKHLSEPPAFKRRLNSTKKKRWNIYLKRAFGGPEHVLEYLGRYTHRVAISNHRRKRDKILEEAASTLYNPHRFLTRLERLSSTTFYPSCASHPSGDGHAQRMRTTDKTLFVSNR